MTSVQRRRSSRFQNDWQGIPGQEYVEKLSEGNYISFLEKNQHSVIMFYAPWCGHCKVLKPEYALAAFTLVQNYFSTTPIGCCNGDANPSMLERFEIRGYPTILYFRNGQPIGEYNAGRRAEDIVNFLISQLT